MKKYYERVHCELDKLGMPTEQVERIEAMSRLLNINQSKAKGLLYSLMSVPSDQRNDLVAKLSTELEVDSNWLMGK